jgi:hypothetical protein
LIARTQGCARCRGPLDQLVPLAEGPISLESAVPAGIADPRMLEGLLDDVLAGAQPKPES